MKNSEVIPVADLRQDVTTVFKKLQNSDTPLFVTEHGRTIAVIQNIGAYEKSEHERELLNLLAVGEKEITAGEGFSLESVLKEADTLLTDVE